MARILVLRGESVEREVEVGAATFTIGRGEQNDLILEDPSKAVSRNHAEIRYEGGRHVLVDRESQNGIWVSGARVPFVILDPKVVASIGPFRFMLENDPTDEFVATGVAVQDVPTEYTQPTITQVKTVETTARAKPTPATNRPSKAAAQSPWLLVGGAAVLIGVAAIAITLFAGRRPAPSPTQHQVDALVADGRKLIEQGDCLRARRDAIDALSLDPNNPEALTLKTRASACIPPPSSASSRPQAPVPLTTDEIAEHLRTATEAIRRGDRTECDAALTEHIKKVLDQEPVNQQATELRAKAEVCSPPRKVPPATPPAAPKIAVAIPPERGGLEPTAGEPDKDYQIRVRLMKGRYDEALAILASGEYQRAIVALESIAADATSQYLDVALRLNEARKSAVVQATNQAHDHETKNEYDEAIQAFRRAAAVDHDARVDDDIKRVQEKKTQAGLDACNAGKAAFAFSRYSQALQSYQQALKLLPADHACAVTAKERIAQIMNR